MTHDEISRQKHQAVSRAVAILQEHFDAGVILVSHVIADDLTARVFRGFGNLYAQTGMADQFLAEEHEMMIQDGSEDAE